MHHCDCTCEAAAVHACPCRALQWNCRIRVVHFLAETAAACETMEVSWKHFAQCYHILRLLFFLACLYRDNTQCRCIMFWYSGMMNWDCLVYVTFKHAHYEFLQTCFILQVFYAEYGGAKKLSEHKRAVSEE